MSKPKPFQVPAATRPLGRHIHLDLYDCTAGILSTPADAERILNAAANKMNATIVGSHFHAFNPYGVSGVVIIAESHLTVHTWPEYNFAAVDVFSCGELDLDAGIKLLVAEFGAQRHDVAGFDRGVGVGSGV